MGRAEAAGQLGRSSSPEAARAAGSGFPRVSADDPVAHLLVELAGHGGGEQRSRVVLREPLERHARQRRQQRARRRSPSRRAAAGPPRPGVGGRRTPGPGATARRATGHRRRGTPRVASRPPRRAGPARRGRPRTDPERPRPPTRTRRAAPAAAGPAARRGRRAAARHSWCTAAKGISSSDSTPAICATRQPDAWRAQYCISAVLPMPASPRSTSVALCPSRTPSSRPSSAARSPARPLNDGARLTIASSS